MAQVMGVLNVTPDSFSDGGRWLDPEAAVAHGLEMVDQGADIVDVGGESSRPGARPVDEAEELRRVIPVVRELAGRVRVSVDTRKRAVAEAAVEAGASIVNDTSSELWPVAAASGAAWITMHMRGDPSRMADLADYDDVVEEVRTFLLERAERAAAAGVEEVFIDPGIGFAKHGSHNLRLLAHLDSLVATGWPVVVGTSRKSFLGRLLAAPGGEPAAVEDRLEGSLATAAWAMTQGVAIVRAHDVAPTVQAARLIGTTADIDDRQEVGS